MTGTLGNPALRTLARLKYKAWLRSLRRRLSKPSGVIFALLGLVITGFWMLSLVLRSSVTGAVGGWIDPELREPLVGLGLFALTVMTLVASLAHRGLYLPKDEIERLLAAPLSRSDLVRYRLFTNLGRSLLFGVVMGLLVAPRMPVPALAFIGAFVAVLTLPILGQAAALLAGDGENRLGRIIDKSPVGALRVIIGVGVWLLILAVIFADDLGGFLPGIDGTLQQIVGHPLVRLLWLPFHPWASAIAATDILDFLPWFVLSLGLTFALFEATVRIPIDFRELSLQTSADVARRLSRFRSGRNMISGAKASKRTLGWNVPWLFGRGPFGAVAWLKSVAILRKARGTLFFSIFVLALVTFMSSAVGTDALDDPLAGSVMLVSLGVLYLGAGLRFDFRSDLDLMESVKSWPLATWRLFMATILPEVTLVTVLVLGALALRSVLLGAFPPVLWMLVPAVPLASLLWIALDNAIFLFAPVRYVPGEGSAMHHTGRTVVLMFLRMLVLGMVVLAVVGVVLAIVFLTQWGELSELWTITLACSAGGVTVAAAIFGIVSFGAWALKRFDVAEGVR